ncbi:MAG: M13 family peptidase, partial [bacterium]|nr:M13 family peptidase [bacterium]
PEVKPPEQAAKKIPTGTTEEAGKKDDRKRKALDPANMDTSVKPGDNFYLYANGNWVKNNPIPAEFVRWNTVDVLRQKCANDIKTLLEEALKDEEAPEGSNRRKIRDFYATAMDEAKIEAEGVGALEDVFKRIVEIKDKNRFREVLAEFHTMGIRPLFRQSDRPDPGNTEIVLALMSQAGLGLPDRDYYTEDNERMKKIREEYLKHVSKMFELLKETPEQATKLAQDVMNIETELAKASMTRVQRRDPKATYN